MRKIRKVERGEPSSAAIFTGMNPKRYSQVERALAVLDRSGTVALLKDNNLLLFLFRKTERISAALFIITSLFPDAEPLKWALRDAGLSLIKDMLSFREDASLLAREYLNESLLDATRVLSLLDISYIAGLVSPMNFSILKKELEGVLSSADGKWKGEGVALSPAFFEEWRPLENKRTQGSKEDRADTVATAAPTAAGAMRTEARTTLHVKDFDKGHDRLKDSVLYKSPEERRQKEVLQVPFKVSRTLHKRHIASLVSDRLKEERTQIIFALLRKKESATTKDFSSLIQECSGKTIQRLLFELVESRVLKKAGERRWSRYSLTNDATEPSVPRGPVS